MHDREAFIPIILSELEDGKPLRQICREQEISKSSVYEWIKADPEFSGRFTRAREIGFEAIAEDCLNIADDKTEEPASRRVRVETRLKLLAKWDPKRFGDKVQTEHSGSVTVNKIERTFVGS